MHGNTTIKIEKPSNWQHHHYSLREDGLVTCANGNCTLDFVVADRKVITRHAIEQQASEE